MKKIMHLLMLSCKKATELIEKRTVTGLSFREKIQLNLHKSMCDACTAYEKQSKKIDSLLQKNIHATGSETVVSENRELKEKIIRTLPES